MMIGMIITVVFLIVVSSFMKTSSSDSEKEIIYI